MVRSLLMLLALSLACRLGPGSANGPAAADGEPEGPAPPGRLVEGTVAAPDGLEIAYDVRGAGDTTLVLVHCWACDRAFWKEQVDVLAATYRVVTLDLGGHGASMGARTQWSIAGEAGDVKAVVDELGLDGFVLVGHSMGGPVTLEVARMMPGKVRAIVCVDTLHDAELVMKPEEVDAFASQVEADFVGLMTSLSEAFPGMDEELATWIGERSVKTSPEAALALLRDVATYDMKAAFEAAKVPIRCVNAAPQGPGAPVTKTETNKTYADYDAVLLDGVGHFLHLEKPDAFNPLLLKTLAQLP